MLFELSEANLTTDGFESLKCLVPLNAIVDSRRRPCWPFLDRVGSSRTARPVACRWQKVHSVLEWWSESTVWAVPNLIVAVRVNCLLAIFPAVADEQGPRSCPCRSNMGCLVEVDWQMALAKDRRTVMGQTGGVDESRSW